MLLKNISIESFSYHLPEKIISSDFIESQLKEVYQKLKLPFGRLELMTGIKERKIWDAGKRPSQLSSDAAKTCLEKSQFQASDIDLLIHSSVCRDCLEPATSSFVHQILGLKPDCQIFDISNACLGFLNSMVVASSMIENNLINTALIVSGENGGPLLNETINTILNDENINRKSIKKYFANLTIGSGAVAFILTNKNLAKTSPQLLGGSAKTDSAANNLCQGNGDINSLMMETDSEELFKKGIALGKNTWEKTKEILSWQNHTPDWIVGHQVGVAHEKLMLETLKLSQEKTFSTYQYLGNTGSAALPITMIKLAEENKLKKGDRLALLGIGSGLSSIMLGVEW